MKPSQMTLTDDEIAQALRGSDKDDLLALSCRPMFRAQPSRQREPNNLRDGALIFGAATLLLLAGFWLIGCVGASRLASSRCLPAIEACR